jgi:hypothetical protein
MVSILDEKTCWFSRCRCASSLAMIVRFMQSGGLHFGVSGGGTQCAVERQDDILGSRGKNGTWHHTLGRNQQCATQKKGHDLGIEQAGRVPFSPHWKK